MSLYPLFTQKKIIILILVLTLKAACAQDDTVIVKQLNDKVWEIMFTDKNKAGELAEKALIIAKRTGNKNSLSDCYNTLGSYYTIATDFKKALFFHQEALKVRRETGDKKGLMKTYNNIGSVYKHLGSFKKEIDYYFMALKLAEEFKDTLVLGAIINNIGDAFVRQENYPAAIEYHLKALKMREKRNDIKGIVASQVNLAIIYYKKKEYELAGNYYKKVESQLDQVEDKYLLALFHLNYAALLKDQNKFTEAKKHIFESIRLNELIGNENSNLANYVNLAAICEAQELYKEANIAYQKSLELSKTIGNLQWLRQSYLGLATTFEKLGDYKKAYTNYLEYETLKDSLGNFDFRSQMIEIERRYKNEKLKAENTLLANQNKIQQLEARQKEYLIITLISLFIICSIIVLLFWTKYRNRQSEKMKEVAVKAEEEERQRIAQDIHDELGSGLTKIRFMSEVLKSSPGNATAAVNTISETSNVLVENMRDLVWVMNPENATLDNLVARIREYCAQYLEEFNIDFKFNSLTAIPAKKISKEINRNIFMIVREALQNIVKHSGAKEVNVILELNDNIRLEITDNGTGFTGANKGNGLINMRSRAEKLKGKFEIAPAFPNGTKVSILIPLNTII